MYTQCEGVKGKGGWNSTAALCPPHPAPNLLPISEAMWDFNT